MASAESGTCGRNLTWTLQNGTLTIFGVGPMADFQSYGSIPWYDYTSSISQVVICDDVTSISTFAFYGCSNLNFASIGNSVTSLGDNVFRGCNSLTSINIPNSVTSIGNSAFQNCSSLTSITIPNSVTSIGSNAFYGCSNLTSASIGRSLTSIGGNAFNSCSGLTSIIVDDSNPQYDSRNNCNAIIEKSSNTLITGCKNTIIPNSVTKIGDSAFRGCSGLTSISIPNSVVGIGSYSFGSCSGLTSLVVGSSVDSIGQYAFVGCDSIAEICALAVVPPTCYNGRVFDSIVYAAAALYVPNAALELYQADDVWKKFQKIYDINATKISSSILDSTYSNPATYLNLNGQHLDKPLRGVNIVNGKKVIMQ